MIQVFDTHRLPYRNAVIRAYKLNSDNVTEPAEFYNFTDYVKNVRDISKYAIGTEVYTNASGYICYGTDRQTVSCLGVNESVVVRVSLDGGISWKIEWTLHGADDMLTTDDFGRLLYADGTVCFDPLQPGDTTMRDFVSTDDIDPNNRWEEDTITVNSDSVTLTDWTRVIHIPTTNLSKTLTVYGHCRAGQCIDVVNEMYPTSSNRILSVKLAELNQTFQVPKGVNFRLVGYGDGTVTLVRLGSFPAYIGSDVARRPGVYLYTDGVVGDGLRLSVPNYGMTVTAVNASKDGGNVGVYNGNGEPVGDAQMGRFLVTDNGRTLRPATVTESCEVTVDSGTTASIVIEPKRDAGLLWLPDVLDVSVVVNGSSSVTVPTVTKVSIGLPEEWYDGLRTTFVVKLTGSSISSIVGGRKLQVVVGNRLVGTADATLTDAGDLSAVVVAHVVGIGDGKLAHIQLDATDGT